MASPSAIDTPCILLHQSPHGEKFQKICLLSPDLGIVYALYRVPKKRLARPGLDIFDNIQCLLQPTREPSNTLFLDDYQHIERFLTIGRDYPSLQQAARWAQVVSRNATFIQNTAELYTRCLQTFRAFANNLHPDVVLLKSLYRLAASEGFPVKEDWYAQLPTTLQIAAQHLLFTPLDALQNDTQKTCQLLESLTQWLTSETPILIT